MKMIDEADFDYSLYGFKDKEVFDGITLSKLDIKHNNNKYELKKGCYRIISCSDFFIASSKKIKLVEKYLIRYLKQFYKKFKLKETDTVLVCGLGSYEILCDSLGYNTSKKIFATRLVKCDIVSSKVCCVCPNVEYKTGINTYDFCMGIAKSVKAKLIILIDSLLTNNTKRIGHSFQLSNCGMTPGGALRNNNEISKETTNIDCISIGVPFMLDLCDISKTVHRSIIVEPKDIEQMVDLCSTVIANAINKSLNKNLRASELNELKFLF